MASQRAFLNGRGVNAGAGRPPPRRVGRGARRWRLNIWRARAWRFLSRGHRRSGSIDEFRHWSWRRAHFPASRRRRSGGHRSLSKWRTREEADNLASAIGAIPVGMWRRALIRAGHAFGRIPVPTTAALQFNDFDCRKALARSSAARRRVSAEDDEQRINTYFTYCREARFDRHGGMAFIGSFIAD